MGGRVYWVIVFRYTCLGVVSLNDQRTNPSRVWISAYCFCSVFVDGGEYRRGSASCRYE